MAEQIVPAIAFHSVDVFSHQRGVKHARADGNARATAVLEIGRLSFPVLAALAGLAAAAATLHLPEIL